MKEVTITLGITVSRCTECNCYSIEIIPNKEEYKTELLINPDNVVCNHSWIPLKSKEEEEL